MDAPAHPHSAPPTPAADDDPALAALLHALGVLGRPLSRHALRARVRRRTVGRWTLADVVDAAESLGLVTETLADGASARAAAPALGEVVLAWQEDGLVRVHSRTADGSGIEAWPGSGNAAAAPQVAGAVRIGLPARDTEPAPGIARGRRGHWFWGPVRLARPLYARAMLAAALTSVFALATSVFSMIVYDRVIPNAAVDTLWALLGGVTIVLACDFVIRTLRAHFLDAAGARADVEIADALFDHVLDLQLTARRGPTGTLASVLREVETLRDFFTSTTLVTLIDIPFALLFIAVLYVIGGPMAAVPVVAIALLVAGTLVIQAPMRRQAQAVHTDSQVKQAVLVEALAGLETIKASGAGALMRQRWQAAVTHQARVSLRHRAAGMAAAHWAQLVFMGSQVAVVTVGVFLAIDGRLGTGAVVAGSILCGRAVQPLSQLSQLLVRWHASMASWRALADVMSLPRESPPGTVRMAHDRLAGSLELEQVSFCWEGRTEPALDAVSLRIEPGERVAVIGRVGSGKSTLVKLLLGLLPPQAGVVRVGGTDIRQIDPADLRRQLGSVLQDVWLMSGTLHDNIALGAERPDDDAVRRAAELAGAHEAAAQHPLGYRMVLGEGGDGLSGGQRQAVALARALIGEPPVLLLDEPTSAMDPTAERALLQRLKTACAGRTVVLVTHKPSMLELVDRVIVLDRGRVIAQGPKDAVLRAGAAAGTA